MRKQMMLGYGFHGLDDYLVAECAIFDQTGNGVSPVFGAWSDQQPCFFMDYNVAIGGEVGENAGYAACCIFQPFNGAFCSIKRGIRQGGKPYGATQAGQFLCVGGVVGDEWNHGRFGKGRRYRWASVKNKTGHIAALTFQIGQGNFQGPKIRLMGGRCRETDGYDRSRGRCNWFPEGLREQVGQNTDSGIVWAQGFGQRGCADGDQIGASESFENMWQETANARKEGMSWGNGGPIIVRVIDDGLAGRKNGVENRRCLWAGKIPLDEDDIGGLKNFTGNGMSRALGENAGEQTDS